MTPRSLATSASLFVLSGLASAQAAVDQAAVAFGILAQPVVLQDQVPAAWLTPRVPWLGDAAPRNGVDDDIDAGPDVPYDVVVNYRRPVTSADVTALGSIGTVQLVLGYVTSVAVGGVSRADVILLAADPGVAFIEKQRGFEVTSEISVAAIKVGPGPPGCSPCYSPDTAYELYGLTGAGVNVVVFDTGVDNHLHEAFYGNETVVGYNAVTQTFEDPVDDHPGGGHGTLVASILLGNVGGTPYGVASSATLIDVKFTDPNLGNCDPGHWVNATRALQTIYDMRFEWNVDVVSMSTAQCEAGLYKPSDGLDSFSQLVDLGESLGIVMVAAAGNDGMVTDAIATPGAATRAITVAGSFDFDTVTRDDDVHWPFSSSGPRADDCDDDQLDELKPDVTAPAAAISCAVGGTVSSYAVASGTSLAAPHVAGIAALVLESADWNATPMNAASVKDAILRGAEPMVPPAGPAVLPGWDADWGRGLVDGLASVDLVYGAATWTDLSFRNYPPELTWYSEDIESAPWPPNVGGPNTVSAWIENRGGVVATDVPVHFGVAVHSASMTDYFDIGTTIVDQILPSEIVQVEVPWTPVAGVHQSLDVEIGYANDFDFENNRIVRNFAQPLTNEQAFQVQNIATDEEVTVNVDVVCYDDGSSQPSCTKVADWNVQLNGGGTSTSYVLGPDDDPVDVVVSVTPPVPAVPGDSILVHVQSTADGDQNGGITVRFEVEDCDSNGTDDQVQLAADPSLDLDANGLIDTCETGGATLFGLASSPPNDVVLTSSGSTSIGEFFNLTMAYAPPQSAALLSLSLVALVPGGQGIPVFGGDLLIFPPALFATLPTNTCGGSVLPLPLPDDPTLVNGTIYWQVAVYDPLQPSKLAFSNGLKLTLSP